jgi:hypothetical protein
MLLWARRHFGSDGREQAIRLVDSYTGSNASNVHPGRHVDASPARRRLAGRTQPAPKAGLFG